MKIQLIKKTEMVYDVPSYRVEVDGKYVSGSMIIGDEKKAKEIFDRILKNNGTLEIEEIVEEVEI